MTTPIPGQSTKAMIAFVLGVLLASVGFAQSPATVSVQPAANSASPGDDLSSLGMKACVTIVFDTSGSMDDRRKLIMAKQAFNWWLETAPKQSIVQWSLWTFDPNTEDGVNLIDRQPNAADLVQARINAFRANGGTPLGRTLAKITKIIDADNKKAEEGKADVLRQIVLIFTDGADSYLSERDMQKVIRQLRDVGAEVFSIGYQGEGTYLAAVSDRFIMVDDEKQLKSGLSEFTYFIEKAGTQKQP